MYLVLNGMQIMKLTIQKLSRTDLCHVLRILDILSLVSQNHQSYVILSGNEVVCHLVAC